MSDLVGSPEDWFSCVTAEMMMLLFGQTNASSENASLQTVPRAWQSSLAAHL